MSGCTHSLEPPLQNEDGGCLPLTGGREGSVNTQLPAQGGQRPCELQEQGGNRRACYDLAWRAAHHFHSTDQLSCVKVGLYKGRGDSMWIWGTPWRLAATLGMWFAAEGEGEGTDLSLLIWDR